MIVNWQDLITNVGTTLVSGTVVVGAVAWVVKALLSDRLGRQAEAFKIQVKADADAANEQLRNSLQMMALEHQVRFSKLHEKRAGIIDDVYGRLVDAEKEGRRFALVESYQTGTEEQKEASRTTETTMQDLSEFIEKRRLYLPEPICALLKSCLDPMQDHVIRLGVYGTIVPLTPEQRIEKHELFMAAHKAFVEELPKARRLLEDEFRKILGGEKSHPPDTAT